MKWPNRILPILLLLTALLTTQAQSPIHFNVQFAPQFAWFSSSDHDAIDPDGSIFHIHAGLQMDYFFQENYAFIIGLGINNLGGKLSYADSTNYGGEDEDIWIVPGQKLKMNLQYLDIPIGLKLKTEEMGYATAFLQLGFNPMFRLNSHVTTENESLDKESIQESSGFFNLGYHVGAGVEYRLGGNTALIGGVRWTSGFTDVTDNDDSSLHTNAISINLGILF